jgi:hypothetical protein
VKESTFGIDSSRQLKAMADFWNLDSIGSFAVFEVNLSAGAARSS